MTKEDKVKKPFYKKWWFWLIIVILIVVGTGSNGSDDADAPVNKNVADSKPSSDAVEQESDADSVTANSEPTAEEESEAEETKFSAGMYHIGSDMPAGEYVIFCDSILAYTEVASDSSGNFDSIITNDNFSYNTILTVSDGQYLTITGGYAMPIEEVTTLDLSGNGTFKVGLHIPAGEYKVEVDADSVTEMAYVEVSTNSSGSLDSIRANDIIENSSYITVNDGEYLTLSGCHIVNIPANEVENTESGE